MSTANTLANRSHTKWMNLRISVSGFASPAHITESQKNGHNMEWLPTAPLTIPAAHS